MNNYGRISNGANYLTYAAELRRLQGDMVGERARLKLEYVDLMQALICDDGVLTICEHIKEDQRTGNHLPPFYLLGYGLRLDSQGLHANVDGPHFKDIEQVKKVRDLAFSPQNICEVRNFRSRQLAEKVIHNFLGKVLRDRIAATQRLWGSAGSLPATRGSTAAGN